MVRVFAHGAMGHQIDPSWGGPIELFLVPASDSTTGVTKAVVCAHPVCRMMHIKEPLLLTGKSSPCGSFLSHYQNGPLLYVRRHITVNKMC